jgi:PLP dependent protein
MSSIAERIEEVRQHIAEAAARASRDPNQILLIAVSKLQPVEAMLQAYAAGIRDFGENYVQEAREKAEQLSHLPDLRIHLIGHLQRNKVKIAVATAAAIHTIDSERLAAEIGRQVQAEGACRRPPFCRSAASGSDRLPVLVEVNVGGEAQKSGCAPSILREVLQAVEAQSGLLLSGLMTVVPWCDDPADTSPYFQRMAGLRNEHGGLERLPELSMGMTHDLMPAIAAGATMVRVGTAIFGERPARGSA